jgi:hypothetical protein
MRGHRILPSGDRTIVSSTSGARSDCGRPRGRLACHHVARGRPPVDVVLARLSRHRNRRSMGSRWTVVRGP